MTKESICTPTLFTPCAQNRKRYATQRFLRFAAALSALLVFATAWAIPCGLEGTGTDLDPFHLESAEDLGAMPTCGLDRHYVITRDIDFQGSEPATATYTFSGHLSSVSGTDRPAVLTNFTISSVDEGYFGGFFQALGGGASINNLILHGATIVVRANDQDTGVGVLAGMTVEPGPSVHVSNVVVLRSSVSALDGTNPRTYKAPHVGGLIGRASHPLEVTNVTVSAVNLNALADGSGSSGAGGLIGQVASTVSISDVSVNNVVHLDEGKRSVAMYRGGLVGAQLSGHIHVNGVRIHGLSFPSNRESGGVLGLARSAEVYRAEVNAVNLADAHDSGGVIGMVKNPGFISMSDVAVYAPAFTNPGGNVGLIVGRVESSKTYVVSKAIGVAAPDVALTDYPFTYDGVMQHGNPTVLVLSDAVGHAASGPDPLQQGVTNQPLANLKMINTFASSFSIQPLGASSGAIWEIDEGNDYPRLREVRAPQAILPPSPYGSTVSPTSFEVDADGRSTFDVTLSVRDATGSPYLQGDEPTPTMTVSPSSAGTVSTAASQGAGAYSFTFSAGTTPGVATLLATFIGVTLTDVVMVSLVDVAVPPSGIELTATPTRGAEAGLIQNVPFDLSVAIVNASGTNATLADGGSVVAYVDGAAQGEGLRIANLHPNAEGDRDGRVALDVPAGATSFLFEDLVFTGTATDEVPIRIVVSGTDGSLASTMTSTTDLTVAPSTLTVAAETTTLFADGMETTVLTATLTNGSSDVGIAGVDIRFATTDGTLSRIVAGRRIDAGRRDVVATDEAGVAQVLLRSGTAEGPATVTASCPGICTESVDLTFLPALANVKVDVDVDGAWVSFDPLPPSVTGLQLRISPSDAWSEITGAAPVPPVRITNAAFATGATVTFEVRAAVGDTALAAVGPFTVTPTAPTAPNLGLRVGSQAIVTDIDRSQPGMTLVTIEQELTFGDGTAPARLYLAPLTFEAMVVQALGATAGHHVEVVLIDASTGDVRQLEQRDVWVWESIELDDAGTTSLSVQLRVLEVE